MITPTPGRIVWFYPDVNDGRAKGPTGPVPLAAIVAAVIHDRCVNLTVSKADGTTFGAQNIVLLQDGFTLADPDRAYAEWMPFQKGQAAKYEAAQAAAPQPTAQPDPMLTDPALKTAAVDLLQPVHDKIDAVAAKVEQVLAAPPVDLEAVHAKIDAMAASTETKFQDLGAWLMSTFQDIQQRLNHPALQTPPSPPLSPDAAGAASQADPTSAEGQKAGGSADATTAAIGAAAAPDADANPNVV